MHKVHHVAARRIHFNPLNLLVALGDFTYRASSLHENVTAQSVRWDDAQQAVRKSIQGHGRHVRLQESAGDNARAFRPKCVQLGGDAFVHTHHK